MDLKENRKRWKVILEKQKDSGKTIVQYCKDNEVNVHQFHYYKRQFKKNNGKTITSSFVEVIIPEILIDDQLSLCLNGITMKIDHPNLIKLLQTVKKLD